MNRSTIIIIILVVIIVCLIATSIISVIYTKRHCPCDDMVKGYSIKYPTYTQNASKICRPTGTTSASTPLSADVTAKIISKGALSVDDCKLACDNEPTCKGFDMMNPTFSNGNIIAQCGLHTYDSVMAIDAPGTCDTNSQCLCYTKTIKK